MTEELSKQLCLLVQKDLWRMEVLRATRTLNLPDAWVGGGFIRSCIWDHLAKYEKPTLIDDVDVVYFDTQDMDEESEKKYDAVLRDLLPNVVWSCKNQARMHLKFGAGKPYQSTEDGLRHWLETPTATAVRLDKNDKLHVLAPFGLEDLFAMRLVPTPYALRHKVDSYLERVRKKPWRRQWPQMSIVWPDDMLSTIANGR